VRCIETSQYVRRQKKVCIVLIFAPVVYFSYHL
jgi:hypothetical protein